MRGRNDASNKATEQGKMQDNGDSFWVTKRLPVVSMSSASNRKMGLGRVVVLMSWRRQLWFNEARSKQQSSHGKQRVNRIQESERGRAGEVVQATLGYNAGF